VIHRLQVVFLITSQVLHRMAERPDEDFTALQFTGTLEDYVRTLDAAASLAEEGAATAMDECDDDSVLPKATPATAKEQKKKAAAAKSKPAAAVGIQKGTRPSAVCVFSCCMLPDLTLVSSGRR
jgi:hypothetical protein